MGIDYNGRKDFSRPRKLEEVGSLEHFKDKLSEESFGLDERSIFSDELFTDLAKTYLKGKVLKEGLAKMEPAQYIPIEEFCDSTRAAAIRIDSDASENGTIITYSMYQRAVDKILEKKWELRGTVLDMRIPASVAQTAQEAAQQVAGTEDAGGLLKEFISQNGIVTTIIGMLTISPFQTVIFQALGVEQGAKGVQMAQIPAGIALFIELGIKAERILAILKDSNLATPMVEQQIVTLSSSESARAEALQGIGIDYNEFKKSQEFQDSNEIVKYVSEFYQRYGGLDRKGGFLTIDHWVAYLQVSQNQQTLRGALNTSSKFSPKFKSIKQQYTTQSPEGQGIFSQQNEENSKIFLQLASATRAIKDRSNDIYDDIISTFNYQLTDRDLCCLVQIFGAIGDPEVMYTIASLLRILATNLAGELVRIQNLISRYLANFVQDALFELAAEINEYYYKIAHNITKSFTTDLDNLTACNGMFTLGWALLHSVRVIFDQINEFIRELSSIIGDFGLGGKGSWQVSADRRHLLGIARILEVLAARLELANTCDLSKKNTNISNPDSNSDYGQAIFAILGSTPPNLVISEEDKTKHFSNITNKTSTNLKFNYGILPEQNNETGNGDGNCYTPDQQNRINDLLKNITSALQRNFNG